MGGDRKHVGGFESSFSGQSSCLSTSKLKFCDCGEAAVLRMSRTPKNPRRMFYGCPNYKTSDKCNFFEWLDEPNCPNCIDKDKMLRLYDNFIKALVALLIVLGILHGIGLYKMYK